MKRLILTAITPIVLLSNEAIKKEKNLFEKCIIPETVMSAILLTEREVRREIGYPFIIRINKEKDLEQSDSLAKELKLTKVSKHVIDCLDYKRCFSMTKKLIDNDIKNIDIGPYQINYFYHPDKIENIPQYFNLETAYYKACKFQEKLVKKYGWSWETVARYHSGTKELNEKYQKTLKYHYIRLENSQLTFND